jgi:large subunit ribosomal protein L25
LYGRAQESVALQIATQSIQKAVASGATSGVLDLQIQGEKQSRSVLLRHIQREPVTREILHVDLYQVEEDRPVRTVVPVQLIGIAPVSMIRDVLVTQELHQLEIESLPKFLPHTIEVDIASLTGPEQQILVGDITPPENVTIILDDSTAIVRTSYSRVAAQVAAQEEAPAESEEATEGSVETGEEEDGAG